MTRRRIVLIEDEESIAEPLAAALAREGFDVATAGTAAGGLEAFRAHPPDAVLLDVMLPDGDGRDVLREIRQTARTPVVMLGADDYVTKPFSAAELAARLRAVLRRAGARSSAPAETTVSAGDVLMRLDTHSVTKGGESVELTVKEFEVLRMLLESAGRLVKREELMAEVWDTNWFGSTKTLDVHVSSLRRKLGDNAASPRFYSFASVKSFVTVFQFRAVPVSWKCFSQKA
jgi:DNA-binding response OmpR family regulator